MHILTGVNLFQQVWSLSIHIQMLRFMSVLYHEVVPGLKLLAQVLAESAQGRAMGSEEHPQLSD